MAATPLPMFGIDVSRHQGGKIDWAKVKASGIQFMIARASLSTTADDQYRANIKRARVAGVPVLGAYHFLYPAKTISAATQAQFFVDRIGSAEGLLTMLDVETDRNRKTHEVFMARINEVRLFAETFASLTGGHPLILYAPGWYWKGHIDNPFAADLGPLNQSRYVDVVLDKKKNIIAMPPKDAFAKVPKAWFNVSHGGWSKATFLQFTSSGKVPGCHGRIDIDAFQGTLEDLRRLTTAHAVPAPAAGAAPAAAAAVPVPVSPVAPVVAEAALVVPPAGPVQPPVPLFRTVVKNDTLSDIAEEFGYGPKKGMPGFRVMIDRFPENAKFRANPGLIHVGDRVRVR